MSVLSLLLGARTYFILLSLSLLGQGAPGGRLAALPPKGVGLPYTWITWIPVDTHLLSVYYDIVYAELTSTKGEFILMDATTIVSLVSAGFPPPLFAFSFSELSPRPPFPAAGAGAAGAGLAVHELVDCFQLLR